MTVTPGPYARYDDPVSRRERAERIAAALVRGNHRAWNALHVDERAQEAVEGRK